MHYELIHKPTSTSQTLETLEHLVRELWGKILKDYMFVLHRGENPRIVFDFSVADNRLWLRAYREGETTKYLYNDYAPDMDELDLLERTVNEILNRTDV